MSALIDPHAPTPEFRDRLERQLMAQLQRDEPLSPTMRVLRRSRIRTVMVLGLGLLIGSGTGMVSAQVQDAKVRDQLAKSLMAERELAVVRLELARASLETAKRAFEAGAASREAMLASEGQLREEQARLQRLEINLSEIKLTSATPRDELWAPLVDNRDFVKLRLALEASMAQQKLQETQRTLQEAERGFQVGARTSLAVQELRLDMLRAESELSMAAQKLKLRQQFLEEHTAPDEITRRLQRAALNSQQQELSMQVKLLEERSRIARQRSLVGAGTELEAKRAELELMEQQLLLQRLNSELKALDKRLPP